MRARRALSLLVLAVLPSCAGSDEQPKSASVPMVDAGAGGNGAISLPPAAFPLPWWAADVTGEAPAAAGGAAPSAPNVTVSGLPNVEFGFAVTIPAGKEMLKCIYAAFPSDRGVIAVPSAESSYTPGSHHLLAYRSDLTAATIPRDKTGVWDCTDSDWEVHNKGSYYEAQQPQAYRDLPVGVAHKFKPGEVLILQAHYVNTTDNDLDARVQLTLHTIDPVYVTHEAGSIIFTDLNITIQPHSRARVSMTCKLPQDMFPALLWSHMHKRGVHFSAVTDDPDAASVLGPLFEESDWSEPQPREFPDPAIMLHAGSHITFTCDYENDSDRVLRFGNSAEVNEMCILHGMYWPRMSSSAERCSGGVTKTMSLGPL